MDTIIEEEVDLSEYQGYAGTRHQIGRLLEDVHMRNRMFFSVSYLAPVRFEARLTAAVTTSIVLATKSAILRPVFCATS